MVRLSLAGDFNWPYLANSIQEFWRRWHMTLSRFLRDYLYIPLGGNRRGPLRTAMNLAITMALGGLWHGAGWSFGLWGLLHAAYLLVNHSWHALPLSARLAGLRGIPAYAYATLSIILTFHAVCLAWCFFRLTDLHDALACVGKLVVFDLDKTLAGAATDLAYGFYLLPTLLPPLARWRSAVVSDCAGPHNSWNVRRCWPESAGAVPLACLCWRWCWRHAAKAHPSYYFPILAGWW